MTKNVINTSKVSSDDVLSLRKKLELSQLEFANGIRLSVRTIRGWEAGRRISAQGAAYLHQIRVCQHCQERVIKKANQIKEQRRKANARRRRRIIPKT